MLGFLRLLSPAESRDLSSLQTALSSTSINSERDLHSWVSRIWERSRLNQCMLSWSEAQKLGTLSHFRLLGCCSKFVFPSVKRSLTNSLRKLIYRKGMAMAMGVVVVSLKMPTTPFSNVLLPNSSRVVSVIASIELESRIGDRYPHA